MKSEEELKKEILKEVLGDWRVEYEQPELEKGIEEAIKQAKKQERKRFKEMINDIKTKIESLNEKNHLEGVRDIFEKSEVDRDKEMIKIAYESQLHLLENIKQKLNKRKENETRRK